MYVQTRTIHILEHVSYVCFIFLVEDVPLSLKYNNKKYVIHMYSVEHNNVFIALMATNFGRYDHNQTNAIPNLKGRSHLAHKMSGCVGSHLQQYEYLLAALNLLSVM